MTRNHEAAGLDAFHLRAARDDAQYVASRSAVREPSLGCVADMPHRETFVPRPRVCHAFAAWSTQTGKMKRRARDALYLVRPSATFGTVCISYADARAVPVDPWLAPVDADRDRSDPDLGTIFLCPRRLV